MPIPPPTSSRRGFLALAISGILWLVVLVLLQGFFEWPSWSLCLLAAGFVLLAGWRRARPFEPLALAAALLLSLLLWYLSLVPSNQRPWRLGMDKVPQVLVAGDHVSIRNVRNFRWKGTDRADACWEERIFDLRKLQTLDLLISPFPENPKSLAHVMFSFGFADGQRVLVSVEARRHGERSYGVLPGLLRQFEVICLFCSEQDPVAYRVFFQGRPVYRYRVLASREFIRALFFDYISLARRLQSQPEFYNSLGNNCNSLFLARLAQDRLTTAGYLQALFRPARTAEVLYQVGMLDTSKPYPELERRSQIDKASLLRIAEWSPSRPPVSVVVASPLVPAAALPAAAGNPAGRVPPTRYHQAVAAALQRRGREFQEVCDPDSPGELRLLAEYGAIFLCAGQVQAPPRCRFASEAEIQAFQASLTTQTVPSPSGPLRLQAAAAKEFAAARDEARRSGHSISPKGGALAGNRSFADTQTVWTRYVEDGLRQWRKKGRLSQDEAARIRNLSLDAQVSEVLTLEQKGIFFGLNQKKTILHSAAPPGSSQHLSLLAMDIAEYADPEVRKILARHGWFQTVPDDYPHFLWLGVPESELSARGLRPVISFRQTFWVPDLGQP